MKARFNSANIKVAGVEAGRNGTPVGLLGRLVGSQKPEIICVRCAGQVVFINPGKRGSEFDFNAVPQHADDIHTDNVSFVDVCAWCGGRLDGKD